MPESTTTIYLVSGANRGIGLRLVSAILYAHPNAFVYAGARDPTNASNLLALQGKFPERIAVVTLVSADAAGNASVAREIARRHGRVDTVIANAGIGVTTGQVADVGPEVVDEHFHVNVTGTIVLFQSVYALLKQSASPRFITISSGIGALDGRMIRAPVGSVAYGASKAALNWVTRKIHFENDWLIAFPMAPGVTATDMLNNNAAQDTSGYFKELFSSDFVVPSVEDVSSRLLAIIDSSTREKEGGEFISVKNEHLTW